MIGNDEARWEKMAQFLVGKRIKTLKLMQKVYCHPLFIYRMLFIYLRSYLQEVTYAVHLK